MPSLAFDLLKGPLFRVSLLKLNDNEHYLTLSAHHNICDGWSLNVIMQDLGNLYSAYSKKEIPNLPEAPSFSKYALEQQEFLGTKEYRQIEQYWIDSIRETYLFWIIPTDFPRPAIKHIKASGMIIL